MKAESSVTFTATVNEWRKIRWVLTHEGIDDDNDDPLIRQFMMLLNELGSA